MRTVISNITDRFSKSKPITLKSASIDSTKSGNESFKITTSLPTTTGAGAFASPITFEVLGNSQNLLNIKLPKSSILNLRYSNKNQKTLALNGSIADLYVELGKLQSKESKSTMIFQRCFNSKNPLSILMSNCAQGASFAVNTINSGSSWVVKKDALLAWSGNHLDLDLSEKYGKLVGIKGSGSFVLSSPGQLLTVELNEGESISVNPASLLAYSTVGTVPVGDELKTGIRSLVELSVPGISGLSVLSRYFSKIKSVTVGAIQRLTALVKKSAKSSELYDQKTAFFSGLWSRMKRSTVKVINGSNQSYFVELKGPKTLLITNAIQLKDKILTEDEVSKLI
ncbi:hypothetical protein CANARDRAFT_199767 [[Candida] arabinofermentans NRRL YB-2248]|uniref:Altered inheritance of mitochondria protein 24, mitochondrial n=1 Tax=[Candida] arabinofermentans NRRL YB-2248 TaxID=983967 RepID=A0A1E4SZR9_9ASCO|nr:hypothetical protein CANARDRAFT_199767 [[Candida] arabinofermentans NRRL YB-2248]